MSAQGNGLSLEQLAQRLEGLQRENAERLETQAQRLETLERENAELRSEVTMLEGSGTRRDKLAETRGSDARLNGEPTSELGGQVSRRALLSKAGAAAVAAMAAGTLLNPREAQAHTGSSGTITPDGISTHFIIAEPHTSGTAISAMITDNSANAVHGINQGSGHGVSGYSRSGRAVRGRGVIGVWGISEATGQAGVYAEHASQGPGVVADGKGPGYAGVLGRNISGEGVRGEGSTTAKVAGGRGIGKAGVWGSSSVDGYEGVSMASTLARRAMGLWETGLVVALASSGVTIAAMVCGVMVKLASTARPPLARAMEF